MSLLARPPQGGGRYEIIVGESAAVLVRHVLERSSGVGLLSLVTLTWR